MLTVLVQNWYLNTFKMKTVELEMKRVKRVKHIANHAADVTYTKGGCPSWHSGMFVVLLSCPKQCSSITGQMEDLAFSIVVNEFMQDGGLTARLADHQHISMGVCVFWHSWLNVCLFWSSWQWRHFKSHVSTAVCDIKAIFLIKKSWAS